MEKERVPTGVKSFSASLVVNVVAPAKNTRKWARVCKVLGKSGTPF